MTNDSKKIKKMELRPFLQPGLWIDVVCRQRFGIQPGMGFLYHKLFHSNLTYLLNLRDGTGRF